MEYMICSIVSLFLADVNYFYDCCTKVTATAIRISFSHNSASTIQSETP